MQKFNSKEEELQFMQSWCLVILKHWKDTGVELEGSFFGDLERAIENKSKNINKIGFMRAIVKTVNDAARNGQNKILTDQLNKRLFQAFGMDLDSNRGFERIRKIVDRGMIKNDKEYQLLFEYFEELISNDGDKRMITTITPIVTAYQLSTGRV